jgi:phenylacetate-coenzyme A ligase PaaK-like adenylate-forming protein
MSPKTLTSAIWDSSETLPRASLTELQLIRLQACVDRIVHQVPFYQAKLAAAAVTAKDLRTLRELVSKKLEEA